MWWKNKEEKKEEEKKYTCGDWKQGDRVQRVGLKNLGIVVGFCPSRMDSVCVEWIKQDSNNKDKVCLVNVYMYPFTLEKANMDDISSDGAISGFVSAKYRGFDEETKQTSP